jgi:hypothetical protein
MSVKISLEFANEDEAIVALAAVRQIKSKSGATASAPAGSTGTTDATTPASTTPVPVPPARPRKPRNDAGKPRGPYKDANAVVEAGTVATVGSGTAGAQVGVTESGSAASAASAGPSTVPPVAPATQTAAPAPVEADKAQPPGVTPAAAVPSVEDVQKAAEKIFHAKGLDVTRALVLKVGGVERNKDIPADKRAEFISRVDGVVDRGEAV